MPNFLMVRDADIARRSPTRYAVRHLAEGFSASMTSRRMGVEGSETWSRILDAAECIIREKGYAAVTSRLIGRQAGLSPQIAYFYFKTMDELFLALFKRLAQGFFAALEVAAAAEDPVSALWDLSCDQSGAVLMTEFLGLSNHSKSLEEEIGCFGRTFNQRQTQIIAKAINDRRVFMPGVSAGVLASLIEIVGRGLTFSKDYEIENHRELKELITQALHSKQQMAFKFPPSNNKSQDKA